MSPPVPSRAPTLALLIEHMRSADCSERKRQEVISAINTVARAIGRSADLISLDLRTLNAEINRVTPATAGLSKTRWRNVQSLVRTALATTSKEFLPARMTVAMSEEWGVLYSLIAVRKDRYSLCRPLRWLSVNGISPAQVRSDDLDRYRQDNSEHALKLDTEAKWANTVRAWNRCERAIAGWPTITLSLVSRAKTWTLPWETFEPSLRAELIAWSEHVGGNSLTDDGPARALRPATLKSRVWLVKAFCSALVLSGRDQRELRSFADCFTYDNFVAALRVIRDRLGTETPTVGKMAADLKTIARHWVKADKVTLDRMQGVIRRLPMRRPGLTDKNRQRLRALRDPVAQATLLHLPDRLRDKIIRGRVSDYQARVMAQMVVALEILLTAPLRIENLSSLEIRRHLIPVGDIFHLVIPANEVKNEVELEFVFSAERSALLRWYLERLREEDPACRFVFPGDNGRHKAINTLRIQLTGTLKKHVGVDMNPHLFRHFAAMLYLDANPGDYETIRQVLGHKRLETTIKFYAGLETLGATRHFDKQIQKLRDAAPATNVRKRKRA